ncbi:hypothetical protein [Paenibacillus pedocola]|uniref:hypothetical protein n=1 Tax=Paenibacillus pedocola TaxID=3242193 RepID=UPI0028773F34|nr:hypothetical protein [Paenibacillus typhae]
MAARQAGRKFRVSDRSVQECWITSYGNGASGGINGKSPVDSAADGLNEEINRKILH